MNSRNDQTILLDDEELLEIAGRNQEDSPRFLTAGTKLKERYRIVRVVGAGGFGVT